MDSNTSERQVVPTQDGCDLWSAIYGAEDDPLIVLEALSDYVMAASRAKLRLDHRDEPIVDAALAKRVPRVSKHLGWPLLLVLQLRHGG